jgi:PAT family beta-lactamase induction signal transducer AmpG
MTNVGFVVLAGVGKSYAVMLGVVVAENLAGGMGTAAMVALLIALCDRRFTATQFALMSGVASIARIVTGPPAGYFVDAFGWSAFFCLTLLMAIPGIVLLRALRDTIDAIDVAKLETSDA